MADWDEDSKTLDRNLEAAYVAATESATLRGHADAALVKTWHSIMMFGLQVPDPKYVGAFRGEKGLELVQVWVGRCPGSPPDKVGDEICRFLEDSNQTLAILDRAIPVGTLPDTEEKLSAVLRAAALVHARWVQIHPFANGNGRTARLLANWLLIRYGIPAFVVLRPRPSGFGYSQASRDALCHGELEKTVRVFRQMFEEHLRP